MSVPVKISIIIPVKPGGAVSALAGLRATDYPADSWEVIVAEGRCPSRQRNRAAAEAAGAVLYFLDDDSRVTTGFLDRVARHYADPAVAAAGGPSLTPDTDTPLQQAFGMAFASVIGGGGMRNRYRLTGNARSTCDQELILCNLSFRRELFLQYGGFDERLYPNEENELMERVKRGGGVLIHDPDLAVQRSQRPTLKAFCRQLFGYGRGRGEQTVVSGIIKPITFVPSLFILYLLLLPLVRKPVYYLPFLCYLLMIGSVAVLKTLKSGRPRSALLLPVVFPLFHICYGAGLLRGVAAPRFRKRVVSDCEVTIRRVKEFGGDLESVTGHVF
ncbi:MAG TPA: glycosyltransferase family 2 protein [Geobacteraceae bacterium]|nr:glycosyltransferase family 2 protein [Geobacteraceae bacterium]